MTTGSRGADAFGAISDLDDRSDWVGDQKGALVLTHSVPLRGTAYIAPFNFLTFYLLVLIYRPNQLHYMYTTTTMQVEYGNPHSTMGQGVFVGGPGKADFMVCLYWLSCKCSVRTDLTDRLLPFSTLKDVLHPIPFPAFNFIFHVSFGCFAS